MDFDNFNEVFSDSFGNSYKDVHINFVKCLMNLSVVALTVVYNVTHHITIVHRLQTKYLI